MYQDEETTCEVLTESSKLVNWAYGTFAILPPASPFEVDAASWMFSLFQETAREDIRRRQSEILSWMESSSELVGSIRQPGKSLVSISEMAEILLRCSQLLGDGLRPNSQPGEYVACVGQFSKCLDELVALCDSIWLDSDSRQVMLRALETHRDSIEPPTIDRSSQFERNLEELRSYLCEQSKPVKGLVLAHHIGLKYPTFRRHYVQALKERYEVRNDRKGYYIAEAIHENCPLDEPDGGYFSPEDF